MTHTIDAKNQKLGRLASRVAHLLQGKNKPVYNPRLVGGEKVVIKNIAQIQVSGRKAKGKVYHHHTGYIGHLKTATYEQKFKKDPAGVLRLAVSRMLPKNRLRAERMRNLVIEI